MSIMVVPETPENRNNDKFLKKLLFKMVVKFSFFLSKRSPKTIVRFLRHFVDNFEVASENEIMTSRNIAVASDKRCGYEYCLERSISTIIILAIKFRKTANWYSGIQINPFRAHAWVEVDGKPIGETDSVREFVKILSVEK